jgi:hypothetical protein
MIGYLEPPWFNSESVDQGQTRNTAETEQHFPSRDLVVLHEAIVALLGANTSTLTGRW